MRTIINRLFIFIIKFYRVAISPFLPPSCRFYPTCSHYALEAFQKHPWYLALFLSAKRVSKCHPWHEGGYDPVPDPTDAGIKYG